MPPTNLSLKENEKDDEKNNTPDDSSFELVDGFIYSLTKVSTGVDVVKAVKPTDAIRYNLSGQKVTVAYKGLVIIDGRKVIVK